MQEIWKDIKNFEGCYQVSNLGRIKSLPKEYIMPNGSIGIRKEKILKPLKRKNGRQYVLQIHFCDYKDEKGKWHYKIFHINRLVAEAFLNFDRNSNMQICHLDGNTLNNHYKNLKIASPKEKANQSKKNGLYEIRDKKIRKKVCQYDLNGKIINTFISLKDAEEKTKIFSQNISRCCRNKSKQAGGYVWKYV